MKSRLAIGVSLLALSWQSALAQGAGAPATQPEPLSPPPVTDGAAAQPLPMELPSSRQDQRTEQQRSQSEQSMQHGRTAQNQVRFQSESEVFDQGALSVAQLNGVRVALEGRDDAATVHDLVLSRDGRAQHVILSQGGWAGGSPRYVAVPIDAMTPVLEVTSVRLNESEQVFQARPEFRYDNAGAQIGSRSGEVSPNQITGNASNPLSGSPDRVLPPTAVPGSSAALNVDQTSKSQSQQESNQTASTTGAMRTAQFLPDNALSAEELIGSTVQGSDGRTLGTVQDIVFTPKASEASNVILNAQTDRGQRRVAFAFDALRFGQGAEDLEIAATSEQIAAAPEIRREPARPTQSRPTQQ